MKDLNELRWREHEHQITPSRMGTQTFGNEVAFEALADAQEVPSIAQRLGIENLLNDPITLTKAEGIENFIKDQMKVEELREGSIGYNTLLERMLAHLPEPLEAMIQEGRALEVLEILFSEAAIQNKLSKETYFKKVEEDNHYRRVNSLLDQLEKALSRY